MRARTFGAACLAVSLFFGGTVFAQSDRGHGETAWGARSGLGRASHVVIPQSRGFNLNRGRQDIRIELVRVRVSILEQTAKTAMEVHLRNPASRQAEAVLLLPVPAGAAVHSFDFQGESAEPSARLLPADEARRTYDSIVAKIRDPALLEFAGYNLVRSSVFPVPANGTQRVRLSYEHILPSDGNRIDYVLPRSEALNVQSAWRFSLRIQSRSPISTVYSPSHELETTRQAPNRMSVEVRRTAANEPGPFLLSYLLERNGVSASLFAYPDPKLGGGYFLLLAGLPAHTGESATRLKREVTLVLDRSGSMAGPKMDQVRAAALQIIEGLEEGEAFNIVDYATTVALFAPKPVVKSPATILDARKYLASIRTTGGTNIHDALLEALRQELVGEGFLPIVLFLTDGLPTVSQTSEIAIREVVEKGNPHARRLFTFGVGSDVNVPLLDRLADMTRAQSTYVLPDEDVEVKVGQVYRKLYGPVLSDVTLETLDRQGELTTRAVREMIPSQLPDLFEGDPLILLGQYRGEEPLSFRLSGNYLGTPRTFSFDFELSHATTRNAFVPRLWASRRIALLIDEIRQAGATVAGQPLPPDLPSDPRFKELSDEILKLSIEFGILTEYTAFLATEGTDLTNWELLSLDNSNALNDRAVLTRSGQGAMNQGMNWTDLRSQSSLNYRNGYWDARMNRVEFSNVQQVNDRAFFRRGNRWIDSRLIANNDSLEPDTVVRFGSEQYRQLVEELIKSYRQGTLSLPEDTLIELNGKKVLIRNGD